MNSFDKDNLKNIKAIFMDKTGVDLPSVGPARRRSVRRIVVLAAAAACFLIMTAFAAGMFSSLSGDDLSFRAVYEGNGVVTVEVENLSNKDLRFQPRLRLMRWTTGEEVEPHSNGVIFQNTEIPAHSDGAMTIDLSGAYDVEQLEEPLDNDWYYFILTNNNFAFGQDWICNVRFADPLETPETSEIPAPPAESDAAVIQRVEEELRFYFGTISWDTDERRAMDAQYIEAYTELFDRFDGNIVPSVSPALLVDDPAPGVILDSSLPSDEQYLLIGQHRHTHDVNFKLMASEAESALVLSAELPLETYDAGTYLPLFYIFTYDRSQITGEDDHAFIHGQILSFRELEEYKVYEDDRYLCYEVSDLIYTDLENYARSFAGRDPHIRFDEQVWTRVKNIYGYYKENLGNLFYYR